MHARTLLLLILSAALATPALAQDAPRSAGVAASSDAATSDEVEAGADVAAGDEVETGEAEAERDADRGDASTLASPVSTGSAEDPAAEDAAAEGAAADAAPSAPLPWRSSLLSWQHGVTLNTLDPGAQLSYDPTYYWSFFLQPRWYFDPQNFLVLSAGLSIEWTQSNDTTTQREPQFGDLALEWRHLESVEGFVFLTSVRLAAPTSLASIAAERVINTGAGLTIVRVVPEAASLTFALSGSYRHWWAMSNTSRSRSAVPCQRFAAAPTGHDTSADGCDELNGVTTEQERITSVLTVSIQPLSGFTLTTQYAYVGSYAQQVTPIRIGGVTMGDMSATHWRHFQYFTLSAAYDVTPWMNLLLGYQTSNFLAPLLAGDGSVRNPFYDPYSSELYLSATFMLDGIYEAIVGGDESDGLTPEQRQRRRQGLASRGGPTTF